MFGGSFQLQSDGQTCLLRIDLEVAPGKRTAYYSLTTDDGFENSWSEQFNPAQPATYIQFVIGALILYLQQCRAKNWTGTCVPVLIPMGVELSDFSPALSIEQFLASVEVPAGVLLC